MRGRGRGRRVFGGNSGYVGYSKSRRAVMAESVGLRNKSQMNKEFADEVNELLPKEKKVTLKRIKDDLKFIQADEWHHTSMYGNRTDYYSARTIADYYMNFGREVDLEEEAKTQKELDLRIEKEKSVYDLIPKENLDYNIDDISYNGDFFKASNGIYVQCFRNMLDKPNENIDRYFVLTKNKLRVNYEDVFFYHSSVSRDEFRIAVNEYIDAIKKAQEKVGINNQNFSIEKYFGKYKVIDCENQGDINSAKNEVIRVGGIVDGVSNESKDYKTGDYYEDKEWFIDFHCDSFEKFDSACDKLGIHNQYRQSEIDKEYEENQTKIKNAIKSLQVGDKIKYYDKIHIVTKIEKSEFGLRRMFYTIQDTSQHWVMHTFSEDEMRREITYGRGKMTILGNKNLSLYEDFGILMF